MQEVITRDLCDLCFKVDEAEIKKDADHQFTLGIGKKVYLLMWCEDHNGKSWSLYEMLGLFQEYGTVVDMGKAQGPVSNNSSAGPRKKGNSGPSKKRYDCSHCENSYKRIDYYEAHLYKKHGIGDAAEMIKCDFPGCEEIREKKRGIGNHKRRVHGVIGIQNHRHNERQEIKEHNEKLYREAAKKLAS